MAKRRTATKTAGRRAGDGLEWSLVAAGELKGHPDNWRRHPVSQVNAFRGVLGELGFVGYVLVNRTTGHVLDGHMRKDAVAPETMVPVLSGAWTVEQERMILATFNPIGDRAGLDAPKGWALLESIESSVVEVQALLEGLQREVDRGMDALERVLAKDEEDGEPGDGDPPALEPDKPKAVKQVRTVMVRCVDELDQMTLLARLKAAGFKVKRAECV